MKAGKVIVSYSCKRTANYQSVGVEATVEVEMEEGGNFAAAYRRTFDALADMVDADAVERLKRLAGDAGVRPVHGALSRIEDNARREGGRS